MSLFEHDRYSVECAAGSELAVMRGIMRLASPSAYDAVFAPVRARIDAGLAATVDLCAVAFMNSSGIRALATLVLLAREKGVPIHMVASEKVPWQKKTMASLRSINPALTVALRE